MSFLAVAFNLFRAVFCGASSQQQEPEIQPHYQAQPQITPQFQGLPPNINNRNRILHAPITREQAGHEGSEMARCFDEAHGAHERGDGAQAKHLSEEGHRHQHKMEQLNSQASDWIFKENNLDSEPGEIDLHGLYVKEAITHTDHAIQAALNRGDSEVHLIVGKGLHSTGHVAKIKPAIEKLMTKHNLSAHLDPHNEGVLIVNLQGQGGGMSSDEVTRRLGRDDEACIIM